MLKISIFALMLCAFSLTTHAQIPSSIDGVTVNINPENPSPGQNVSISIESYNTDLSSATMIWSVGGKVYSQGLGIKSISIPAPKLGLTLIINVLIKTSEGRSVQKTVSIKSGSVDMIWEARGYVPAFFKGKSPFVYQNSLHIVAIPHLSSDGTKEINPGTLIYKWKINGKNIDGASGYGKQSVDIEGGDIPKQLEINVLVNTKDEQQSTVATIILDPTEPSLSFYEEDPLYGIFFNKALFGRVVLKNSEMKVISIPFGFNFNNQISYVWSINNIEKSDLSKNKSITIRTKGDQEGSSNINLDIRNLSSILQGARGEFTVYFNKKPVQQDQNVTF